MFFLQEVWFPVIGNFNDLHAEYEIRDYSGGYRYLDFAYMPGGAKGCIEVQDFRSHARDVDSARFKDLCMKQALLVLDDWAILPVAVLSIREDVGRCKQLVLSFVGKFLSAQLLPGLNWAEAESLRFCRRLLRPIEPKELAAHLGLSENRTRVLLRTLVGKNLLTVASGKLRYRTYQLRK
ncbi:transcriptional regulator [Paenibacillus sp. JSM ZJ436]|uniref:transcriptional regulator n=1 Tax=Paenibacillus sp. JSM ZJ436 TaxID=3376190 RepID=UPI0037C8DC9D